MHADRLHPHYGQIIVLDQPGVAIWTWTLQIHCWPCTVASAMLLATLHVRLQVYLLMQESPRLCLIACQACNEVQGNGTRMAISFLLSDTDIFMCLAWLQFDEVSFPSSLASLTSTQALPQLGLVYWFLILPPQFSLVLGLWLFLGGFSYAPICNSLMLDPHKSPDQGISDFDFTSSFGDGHLWKLTHIHIWLKEFSASF